MTINEFRLWLDGVCIGSEDVLTQDQIYRIHEKLETVDPWPDKDAGSATCGGCHCCHCGAPQ